jgi:hypothetical protein
LTTEDVIAIRGSDDSIAVIARKYGISSSTASLAKRGLTWKSAQVTKESD